MNRIIALVVAVVIVLFVGSSMIFVVDERHAAVVSAHGEAIRSLRPRPPFQAAAAVQTATLIDTRTLTIDETGSDRFTTSDKSEVLVNTVHQYRVTDPLKLLRKQREEHAERAGTPDRARPHGARERVHEALAQRRARRATGARKRGAEVDRASRRRRSACRSGGSAAHAHRLSAGRRRFGLQTHDRGAPAGRRRRAREGHGRSGQDQGRRRSPAAGDARGSVQSGADDQGRGRQPGRRDRRRCLRQRDPQFYQFYQSLEAYKKTFKPGDVMVLDPSSDFFRFMRGPNGGLADVAPALKR